MHWASSLVLCCEFVNHEPLGVRNVVTSIEREVVLGQDQRNNSSFCSKKEPLNYKCDRMDFC